MDIRNPDRYTFDSDQRVEGPDGIPYEYHKGDSILMVDAVRLGLAKEERAQEAAPENRAEKAAPENRAAAAPDKK